MLKNNENRYNCQCAPSNSVHQNQSIAEKFVM